MRDAFLTERDAHCVRDAGFARDARLRRVNITHRITYHSEAASLITDLFRDSYTFLNDIYGFTLTYRVKQDIIQLENTL